MIENATGTRAADRLAGNGPANILRGGSGDDRLIGEGGNERLYGQDGDDTISGGTGKHYIRGGDGDDRIYGDPSDDEIYDDGGNDLLYGGTGDDLFVFVQAFGQDRIADFETDDRIDLRGVMSILDWDDLVFDHLRDTSEGAVIMTKQATSAFSNPLRYRSRSQMFSSSDCLTGEKQPAEHYDGLRTGG